ncbi:MAG: stage II sporulation protein M [Anaerolineae bacterium]|nr:stage II sporulation protein M [Anaerolineae bacterium]
MTTQVQEHPSGRPSQAGSAFFEELRPIWVIVRREVIDTLRDWRIVGPIVILVLGFPFLANFAASRGVAFVNQYGANIVMERLLPFLMLVVGFFPSSFSLVIALETFTGEKERRSLESLLSTPLTDLQLYVGKLMAATIPPVVASYLGMLFYVGLVGFSMHWWPSLYLLFLGFVLSTAEALVMVAGAIVVSSQSTSVRAANLLASFIIIPMAFLLQAEASMLLFANYPALWSVVFFLLVLNVLLIRMGLRIFDREHLLGRDIDTLDVGKSWQTFWEAVWPYKGLKYLYFQEIPSIVRGIRLELLVTLIAVVVGGWYVGTWASHRFALPPEVFDFSVFQDPSSIEEAVQKTGLISSFSVWTVWYHNARSLAGAALLAVFSMGILAILLLMAPVILIVYIVTQVGGSGVSPWLFMAVAVLPHGIIELPVAILATAQAMRVGDIILSPPEAGGGLMGVLRELGHFVKLFAAVILPLLLLAAFIEAEITPRLAMQFLVP